MNSRKSTKPRTQRGKVVWNPKDNVSDLIHCAILAHQQALCDLQKCTDEENYLEQAYPPRDGRRTPLQKAKYRDHKKRYDLASDAEIRTAWALTTAIPSTWDGLEALLAYAVEYTIAKRMAAPDTLHTAPASVQRLHKEFAGLGHLSEGPWWVALILTTRMTIEQLRMANPDASLSQQQQDGIVARLRLQRAA
ncbi:MAG: hypothetical protein ABSD21_11230 [Rhizomicrobium sp.]|jgi:N-acyl-D-aspartate/D-glutamate deacylase